MKNEEKYYSLSLKCDSEDEAVKKRLDIIKMMNEEKYKNIKVIRIFDIIQFIGNENLIKEIIFEIIDKGE